MGPNRRHLGREADRLSVAAVLALVGPLLTVCSCSPPPTPQPPGPVFDAGPSDASVDDQCAAACANMAAVNERDPCPGYEGAPSPDGVPCVTLCVSTELGGVARFCPVEMAQATNCLEMQQAWGSCE